LKQIKKILENGGIIAYPTETVYGLGCDPFQKEAVEKIFRLKGRKSGHVPLILIPDQQWLHLLVEEIPSEAIELMKTFWPGPLTIALKAAESVPAWLRHSDGIHAWGTVAVRISSHPWVQEFLSFYGQPIISTSANLSGSAPLFNIEKIKEIFGKEIDYYVDDSHHVIHSASTIVSFHDNKLRLIREGVISLSAVEKGSSASLPSSTLLRRTLKSTP